MPEITVTAADLRRNLERELSRRVGARVEFARFAQHTVEQLEHFGVTADDIAEWLGPEAAKLARATKKRASVTALVDAAVNPPKPQLCAAPGCKAPATRMLGGKACCGDDAHRLVPLDPMHLRH